MGLREKGGLSGSEKSQVRGQNRTRFQKNTHSLHRKENHQQKSKSEVKEECKGAHYSIQESKGNLTHPPLPKKKMKRQRGRGLAFPPPYHSTHLGVVDHHLRLFVDEVLGDRNRRAFSRVSAPAFQKGKKKRSVRREGGRRWTGNGRPQVAKKHTTRQRPRLFVSSRSPPPPLF